MLSLYIYPRLDKLESVLEEIRLSLSKPAEVSSTPIPKSVAGDESSGLTDSDSTAKDTDKYMQRCLRHNMQSRVSPYLSIRSITDVERFPVPDDKVKWEQDFHKYTPVSFTTKEVLSGTSYSDINLEKLPEDERGVIVFNEMDKENGIDRRTFESSPYLIVQGLPRNPIGRTGMTGRGCLGRWGPNWAWDPVITRWKKDKDNCRMKAKDGKHILEFLAVLRLSSRTWSLPGGMREGKRNMLEELKVNFRVKGMEGSSEEENNAVIRARMFGHVKQVRCDFTF